MTKSDWPDIWASFCYLVFLRHDSRFHIRDGETAGLLQRPLNHLYEDEGSKSRDERRVTKRNVATRRADGLGLIEIYSTLGNQELYILPRVRSLSRTPYYPELRLIDTRLPAVIYISRVI